MMINDVLFAMRHRDETGERAEELAKMAYIQWLGSVSGEKSFPVLAREAIGVVTRERRQNDVILRFCEILRCAADSPLSVVSPSTQKPKRRGGARARRARI